MEMQQMHHHHLHHHHHLPFLQHSSSESDSSSSFDAIFAGVSLQSLLLGEPVLITPPPPPFPPLSPAQTTMTNTTITPFAQPLQYHDNRVVQPHHPPKFLFVEKQHEQSDDHLLHHPQTFIFQADVAEKQPQLKRRQPARRGLPQCSSSSTRNHAAPPRRQRPKVSEKLKALRRIVPCNEKADIATMLEQAYRYVRFLEAQVLALLTMQFCTPDDGREGRSLCLGGGGTSETERRMIDVVGRLSRQEVVEAVVNSGTAQKVMYEEGLCLVSEEQVRVLGWATFQKQQKLKQLSGLIGNDLGNNNNTPCSSYSYSYSYSH